MLVKYTRATRRAQEFFFHSFRPPQAKLHTWPSLIHDRCALQARHIHTYSDATDALKTGVRNVKENIKEGVKTDLVLYLFVLVINMFFFGLQTGCSDLQIDNASLLGRL